MNEMQRLEQLKNYFWVVRSKWKWMLLALAVTGGGAWLLNAIEDRESVWFTIVLCVTLAAAALVLFWVASVFLVNTLKKKLADYYANGAPVDVRSGERVRVSSSRLLSFGERLQAYANFKELRDISTFCFRSQESYLRIQWLKSEIRKPYEPKDLVMSWPESDQVVIDVPFPEFDGEVTRLWVVKETSNEKGRESTARAFAYLTAPQATLEERKAAYKVPLVMNEPCLLAYEVVEEHPNGTQKRVDEPLCAITWIGGNG